MAIATTAIPFFCPPGSREEDCVFFVRVQFDARRRYNLELHGELDMSAASTLFDAVVAVPLDLASEVVLDLTEVSFMDSSGIAGILSLAALCSKSDVKLKAISPCARVRRILEVTGLTDNPVFSEDAHPPKSEL